MIKERNCALKDILLWKSSRRKIKYANLPADTDLPNPVAWKDSLVVGTFSPQSITCLDRATGQHKWTKSLGRIGSATPTVSNNGLIFIPTQQSIECLDINNGNTLWSYAPHPQAAEAFYATPVISGNRLYISSTTGMTHCLNRTSGQPIWAMQVTQEGQMVNSTALVHSGLVIVGTNNRSVVAIDAKAGKARWQTRLDSNCTSRTLLVNGAAVVHTSSTAYFLDPSDGTVISKWRRRNWEIKGSTQNKNRLFLSISRVPQNYNTARLRDIPADPSERVVCLVDQQLQWIQVRLISHGVCAPCRKAAHCAF